MCASCGQDIYDGQYLQALGADWHGHCFRWGLGDTAMDLGTPP